VTHPLVIVESPAKARTIAGYLGDEFVVESSIGHIRDLPRNASDVPDAVRGEPWARLGIDVDNDFKPLYVISRDKKDQVRKLRSLVKDASELLLATDEDREGEAIAWHLLEVLNPRIPVKRMVFHEITPEAIRRAIDNPRDLDRRLVDAQEARRLLDRLYGYEVSPVLWKKVSQGLSAGRVQSVATRIVVERERERMAFRSASYWDLEGRFRAAGEDQTFTADLVELDGRRVATGRDFGPDGKLRAEGVAHLDEAAARALVDALTGAGAVVRSREAKPYRRRPPAPFITSTFQQEAGRKLRLSSAQAMRLAQSLYERGFITYMRTDSTTLSDTAVAAARSQVARRFGDQFVPASPRRYERRVKNAQEAHEAIRPAGDRFRTPDEVRGQLRGHELAVYELIWQRTLASQMTDATGETVTVRLGVAGGGRDATFSASGTVITHPGFLAVYTEGRDDGDDDEAERRLPALTEGDAVEVAALEAQGHETQPPFRYTEATLIRRLEELGVGRPSTYASIMGTIQDRGYVWKKGSALVPSFTAFAVVTLLEQHFPDLVDYAFTARMEENLDEIASGGLEPVPWLSAFYFGVEQEAGLRAMVSDRLGDIDARAVNSISIGSDPDGVPIVVRVGRYGPYLERGEDRASIPEDLPPDELTPARALELLAAPRDDRQLGVDPDSGLPVLVRSGRFGPYVQLGEADDGDGRVRTASLFKDMDPRTVTLDDALRLLSLPRWVGVDPADGEEILALNGRFGPYLKKGSDTRSLDSEHELFTVDLERALALFAEPKRRRGQRATGPLRELGTDPATGRPLQVRSGRFGPYVTDGEVNASLRTGDEVETLTVERASELVAERRAKGGATRTKAGARKAKAAKKVAGAKKAGAKKAGAKKAGAKKARAAKKVAGAKKAGAKKAGAKKARAAKKAAGAKKADGSGGKAGPAGSTPRG
jgi:DNA topoisomerase-1